MVPKLRVAAYAKATACRGRRVFASALKAKG